MKEITGINNDLNAAMQRYEEDTNNSTRDAGDRYEEYIKAHADINARERYDLMPPAQFISTGLSVVDKAFDEDGFEEGSLVVFVGEPGSGKTTLTLNMVCHMASQGYDIFIYTLEMQITKIRSKILSMLSTKGVDVSAPDERKSCVTAKQFRLKDQESLSEEQKVHIETAWKEYKEIERHIIFLPASEEDSLGSRRYTVNKISKDLQEYMEVSGGRKPVVLIDSLQRLDLEGTSDMTYKAAKNVDLVSDIALQFGCLVLLICASNRNSYGSNGGISSCRDSSQIEFNTDCLNKLYEAENITMPDGITCVAFEIEKARYASVFAKKNKILLDFYWEYDLVKPHDPALEIKSPAKKSRTKKVVSEIAVGSAPAEIDVDQFSPDNL